MVPDSSDKSNLNFFFRPHFFDEVLAGKTDFHSETKKKLHIYCLNIFENDAVSNAAVDLACLAELWGFDVSLYAGGTHDSWREKIGRPNDLLKRIQPEDLLMAFFSIGDLFMPKISELKNKKIFNYLGITPPELVAHPEHPVVQECILGLRQLGEMKNFDLYMTMSDFTMQQMRELLPPSSQQGREFLLIPPAVTFEKLMRLPATKPAIKSQAPFLLYVGRMFLNKNVHKMIEMFARLEPKVRGDLELYLVGNGRLDEYQALLEKTISENPAIASKVHFFQNASDSELRWFYENATALFHLSRHEGFGMTLVEAMLFGLPSITHRVSAIPGTLKDVGIFLDSDDQEKSVRQIEEFLLSPDQQKALRKRLKETFATQYSDKVQIEMYRQLFRRIEKL